jgi:hypothetical protein
VTLEEGVRPTPEQWVELFVGHDYAEQVKIAENVLRLSEEANLCFIANHVDGLARANELVGRFVLERAAVAKEVEALCVDIDGPGGYAEGVRDAAYLLRHPGSTGRCTRHVYDDQVFGGICVLEHDHDGECRAQDS